jgi:TfoX/Sxy family transcriptional regulator of competence genes
MATEPSFVEYVLETARFGARLTHKKMFGEYALYLDGKVVAFACDNSLFIKPSQAAGTLAPDLPQGPPYPGAKDYPIADELLDDPDALRRLIEATAALMPPPKPKKPAKAKASA